MAETLSPEAQDLGEPSSGKMPVWGWVLIGCGGLSLMGILLFVMVPIIAAIAIPSLLAAKRSSFETAAVGSMRCYAGAQVMYKKVNANYANPYTKLFAPQDSTKCFIAKDFADAVEGGARPKQGYYFHDMKTIGGKPIDWTKDFAFCARPAAYGKTGHRSFIVTTDGTVYGKDNGGVVEDDFPADLAAAGWEVAE